VACLVEAGSPDAKVCAEKCPIAKITRLDGTHELPCTYQDAISYEVKLDANGTIILQYADLPRMY